MIGTLKIGRLEIPCAIDVSMNSQAMLTNHDYPREAFEEMSVSTTVNIYNADDRRYIAGLIGAK